MTALSFAFIEQNGDSANPTEHLVSGYIRESHPEHIPMDIIKLCHDYCKHCLTWRITHNQFISFQNKSQQSLYEWHDIDDCLLGPVFTVRGFEFECRIKSTSRAQFIQFEIVLLSMHKYIESEESIRCIIAYYEVCCHQTKSSDKDSKVLRKIGDSLSWPMYNMRVKECIDLQTFTFDVFLDIFKVYYKTSSGTNNNVHRRNGTYEALSLSMIRSIHYRPIQMHERATFCWNINGILLDEFKKSDYGKYWYSDNFGLDGSELNGDNFSWCLYTAPHGYNHMSHQVYIGIVLLNLPPKIKKIDINFVIRCTAPNGPCIEYRQFDQTMHHRSNCVAWHGTDELKIRDIRKIKYGETMRISVQIDIVRIVNDKGNEIDKRKWEQFGIVRRPTWPAFDLSKSFAWLAYLHQR